MDDIDVLTWPKNRRLWWTFFIDGPTRIFVDGIRVKTPTRIIDGAGLVIAVDLVDTDPRDQIAKI